MVIFEYLKYLYFFFFASRTAFRACLVARRFVVFFDLDVLSRALIRLGMRVLYSKILFFGILKNDSYTEYIESNFIQFFLANIPKMNLLSIFEFISPFSVAIHVLSVVCGMGGALIADLLFSFYSKDKRFSEFEISTLGLLARVVKVSLYVIIVSGLFIFLSDVNRYLVSAKFLSKMTILVALVINGYILNTYVWSHILARGSKSFFAPNEKVVRQIAFVGGAISVVSWITLFMLGTLESVPYAYSTILSLYASFLFLGAGVALMVEAIEFEFKKRK